jgi:hypothetical protein
MKQFFSLHLVIDNSQFLLHLVMNNDYLGYIKIFIHLFIPLKKLLSSTKERCKDRTISFHLCWKPIDIWWVSKVLPWIIFKALPRLYHQNFNRFPSYFLQGSTIKISMCFKGFIFWSFSCVWSNFCVDSTKNDEIVHINL